MRTEEEIKDAMIDGTIGAWQLRRLDGSIIVDKGGQAETGRAAAAIHEETGETLVMVPFAWSSEVREYVLDEQHEHVTQIRHETA